MTDFEKAKALFLEGSKSLKSGDLDNAEIKLLDCLRLFPNRESTKHNLAILYTAKADKAADLCEFERALSLYSRAIDYDESYPVVWSNKAAVHNQLCDDVEEAISCLRTALDLMPDYPDAYINLGVAYQKQSKHTNALESFDRAIQLNPELVEAWAGKGVTLNDLGLSEQAFQCFEYANILQSDLPEIWLNRGISLSNLNRHQDALQSFDYANSLNANLAEVWLNRSIALNNLNRFRESLKSLDHAIRLKPNLPEAWNNRGYTLNICKLYSESLSAYDWAIKIKNSFAEAYYNRAILHLQQYRFRDGFQDYIWRWQVKSFVSQPLVTTLPRCTPELLEGRILLWAEQGLGDEVFYAGLFQNAIDNSLKLTVSADRRLHTIFKRSFPSLNIVDRKHVKNEDLDKKFDSQAPIGDLAYLLKLDKDDIKRSRRPFLLPDGNRVLDIKRNHPFVDNRLVCGISWRSNNRFFGEAKSIKLEELRTLFEKPNLSFVNLQYGEVGAEIQDFEERFGPKCHQINNLDLYNDVEGLTALIAACDVVVTTSSVTAHLAGAIGKRGCVLVPFSKGKIWYWHLNDECSFWYPSLKVFYQDHPSDWSNAILQASEWLAGISPTLKN
jgi:tetratricopeptide (TPR) repeat protein